MTALKDCLVSVPFSARGRTGIGLQNLPVVVRLAKRCSPTSEDQVVQEQLAPILIGPSKIIGGLPWNVVAKQPGTRPMVLINAVERVEIRGLTIIGEWYQGTTDPRRPDAGVPAAQTGGLDSRSVGFKRHSLVLMPFSYRAGELDRGRVQVRIAIGPDRLVGDTVEARNAGTLDAPVHLDQCRGTGRETPLIVGVGGLPVILGVPGGAGP